MTDPVAPHPAQPSSQPPTPETVTRMTLDHAVRAKDARRRGKELTLDGIVTLNILDTVDDKDLRQRLAAKTDGGGRSGDGFTPAASRGRKRERDKHDAMSTEEKAWKKKQHTARRNKLRNVDATRSVERYYQLLINGN